jgi:dihydrofolate reductase
MRKVILFMHISLDGFVGRPNGEMDWVTMNDDEMGQYLSNELLSTVDTMLLGRTLYQGFASYWPAVAANASMPKELISFANWIENTPKVIFSRTLQTVDWINSRLAQDKITEEISQLKQQPGKDMVIFGGASLAKTFASLGLIDEYRFKIEPIALGRGKALFEELQDKIKLKLIKSKTFSSGVIGAYYQPI